jgi:hypothetical protein
MQGDLQVKNPSIDGSITWTLRKPRLLFFTPQDLRFRLSANMDNSNDASGNRISGKKGLKAEADTRLMAGVRLNGMWQKQISDTVPETKWSTSFRWRF